MKSKTMVFLLLSLMLWAPLRGLADPSAPLSVKDTEAILAKKGERVEVVGDVHNAFWVRNQVLMITFQEERGGFVAVSFARHRPELDEAFDGDTVKAVSGKRIRVSGVVSVHDDRPQIIVETADQVKILD